MKKSRFPERPGVPAGMREAHSPENAGAAEAMLGKVAGIRAGSPRSQEFARSARMPARTPGRPGFLHTLESGNPELSFQTWLIKCSAWTFWIPAFAGMTERRAGMKEEDGNDGVDAPSDGIRYVP